MEFSTEHRAEMLSIVVALVAIGAGTAYYFYYVKKPKGCLDPENFEEFKLVKKTHLSHNVAKFRFALPTPNSVLGLPIGQHMSCRGKDAVGEEVVKPYTPTTLDSDVGHFKLVIKVLSRSGKAEVLTDPHRPYGNGKASLREIRRIREAGGWVVNGRICGDIAVSRALVTYVSRQRRTSRMLKKGVEQKRWSEKFASRIKFNGDLVVSSADVYQISLGTDAEFVVLASDGLWDFMSSTEAVDFVRNQLRQYGDVQLASEALAQGALDCRSQDNITIVIADLGRVDWQSLPPPQQQQNVLLEVLQALATIGIVSAGIWISSYLSL